MPEGMGRPFGPLAPGPFMGLKRAVSAIYGDDWGIRFIVPCCGERYPPVTALAGDAPCQPPLGKGAKARVQSLVLSQKHWFFPVGDDPRASRVGYRTMTRAAEGVGPYGVKRDLCVNAGSLHLGALLGHEVHGRGNDEHGAEDVEQRGANAAGGWEFEALLVDDLSISFTGIAGMC